MKTRAKRIVCMISPTSSPTSSSRNDWSRHTTKIVVGIPLLQLYMYKNTITCYFHAHCVVVHLINCSLKKRHLWGFRLVWRKKKCQLANSKSLIHFDGYLIACAFYLSISTLQSIRIIRRFFSTWPLLFFGQKARVLNLCTLIMNRGGCVFFSFFHTY